MIGKRCKPGDLVTMTMALSNGIALWSHAIGDSDEGAARIVTMIGLNDVGIVISCVNDPARDDRRGQQVLILTLGAFGWSHDYNFEAA